MFSISTWNYLKCFGNTASFEKSLDEIKEQGYGVELWLNWTADQSLFLRSNWEYLKEICSDIPKLSAHTKLTKHFSLETLLEEMDFCEFIGADPLVCHPFSLGLQTGTWDFKSGLVLTKENKDLIGTILTEADRRSLHIALENGSMDILLKVIEAMKHHPASDSLGICIDTGHANMHLGLQDSPVVKILHATKHKLIHLHVHDNNGQLDDHQVPGKGVTNWQKVLTEIHKIGYSGDFVFELNTKNPKTAAEETAEFINKQFEIISKTL